MRSTTIITAIALAILSISAVSAYSYATPYSQSYVTPYTYGYGYGSSYGYAAPSDGHYRLTSYSPSSYPHTYSYASNSLFMGHYSRFDGRYHDSWTNRPINPVRYTYGHSNAIPMYKPYNPYTVHYE